MKTCLVLEGGGLRGVYTSGVLEVLMENKIDFDGIIGVSMGACNAANFLSKQKQRNKQVNIDYVNDKRYLSYRKLITHGELFQTGFIYDTIPNKLNRFDYETFMNNPTHFWLTVTNCKSGKAEYFEKSELDSDFIKMLQASTSLPFISHPVKYKNKTYMDGGLSDSIPIKKAKELGFDKIIVILTREQSYRKKKSNNYMLAYLKYAKYPGLIKAIKSRPFVYNNTLKYISEMEKKGAIFVLRPSKKLIAKRIEREKKILYDTYQLGYNDMQKRKKEMQDFIAY